MARIKPYDYTRAAPILKRAGIACDVSNLSIKNTRRTKHVQKLFVKICKKYGVEYGHQKRQIFRESFYSSVYDGIIQLGRINEKDFKAIVEPLLIEEFQYIQDKLMKRCLGRSVLPEHAVVIGGLPGSKFYNSPEWRALRYATLERYGNKCQACGICPKKGAVIHVDHIKPRSYWPELALDPENLQILCEGCNMGKSNRLQKDWREPQVKA